MEKVFKNIDSENDGIVEKDDYLKAVKENKDIKRCWGIKAFKFPDINKFITLGGVLEHFEVNF